jgi:predicted RNA methylase
VTTTTPAAPAIKPTLPVITGSPGYQQAFGALEVWAAGLDGKISAEELKKIQDSLQAGWNSTQSVRDYLKSVNDRINAGQTDAVINEALKTLSQQVNEKKVLVMNSVLQMMRDNGITWDQAKVVLTKWITEVLKLSPMDVINSLKP